MDLIDKIDKILRNTNLKFPIIELRNDDQGNITGHISDETFNSLSDKDSQELIWTALRRNLESDEILRVIAIFHETPSERVERLTGYRTNDVRFSNFWFHQTPELAKYWLFIDVAKFGEDFKSFYIIVSEKNNIKRALTFVYNKEVLSFMDLEHNEIHEELYSNTFGNAEAEIKMDLMNKYERLSSQQLYGKANMYWYVYESFKLKPVSKNQLIFTDGEISMISKQLEKIDNFSIKKDIQIAIHKSTLINKMKKDITQ
ncbi:hypothetical protein H8S95_01010 [Pontibacter sp. KCTC 32443]|uniref:hypothetical protein n=1 Tax=Pontibacter TaxID=323449 RepID=UPI00164E30D7|nr:MULTISPECIES: hypothetical protein [Pontibacter]MBC5772626.1 hypothetical protein [Pontibacter sp. KCTC 32443]